MMKGQGPPLLRDSRADTTHSVADEFTDFYRAEVDGQVRRAALLLGSNDAANDVVHDALTSMYKRWSSIAAPGPYLNRAVLNACRDLGRHRTVARRADRRLGASEAQPPDDELFDLVAALPFNQRAAVVLRFYGRMTENDIADVLGCPPGSVGPWIKRALDTMRKELS